MTRANRRRSGFTLVELLIAMVVLAIAGAAVSSRVSETFNQIHSLERRTFAHMVGENYLTRYRLEQLASEDPIRPGSERERMVMANRDWLVEADVIATTSPTLHRVEVSVYEVVEGDEIGPVDFIEAFVGEF